MGKLLSGFLILFFLMAVPRELAAQTFFSRILNSPKTAGGAHGRKKVIKQKRYHCGEMDAYNKKRAFRRHKKGRFSLVFSGKPIKEAEKGPPIAQNKPVNKPKPTPPPSKSTAGKPQPKAPVKQPPQPKPPVKENQPPASPPPLAEKAPATPPKQGAPPVSPAPPLTEIKEPQLSRNALKKMTEDERRNVLLKQEPDIVLTPLQFISNQDEFSVVNMDSFIQAMEYAQQGKVVFIEGHTDDVGKAEYNLDLSMKRAEKIRELLLSGGISDELISVIGYGEGQPIVPNTSAENRSINRRIEFKIFSLTE